MEEREQSSSEIQSIDSLIRRIKNEALDTEASSSEKATIPVIKNWFEFWQQRHSVMFEPAYPQLYDPKAPRLSELLSAHLDEQAFVERAYIFLTGRLPDPQGRRYYQQLAAQKGRITALITLYQASETQHYLQRNELMVPSALKTLSKWHNKLTAWPSLRHIGGRVWQKIDSYLWLKYQQQWHDQSEWYEGLERTERYRKEHKAFFTTLEEMAYIQQHLDTTENVKGLSIQQANTLLKLLASAKALDTSEEGSR